MTAPERGFTEAEHRARLAKAQAAMEEADLAALLLTTEPDIRYFSGFLTRFWESPTRPWHLVVPASGDPVAVIPTIGEPLMRTTWIADIRSWRSPDLADDGVGLLAEALREIAPESGRIGVPSGPETHLRMPLDSWRRLGAAIGGRVLTGDAGVLRALRLIKSAAEIAKIRAACAVASRAFDRVPEIAHDGAPLETVFRRFQALCLEEGADWVGYLAGGAGPDGYRDVISPAEARPLAEGDVLMLDTGVVLDGYFSDFDRNYAVGAPSAAAEAAYARLLDASDAGLDAARPGATAAELFAVMDGVLGVGPTAGRLGHGLGARLTEPPSLIPEDHTPLAPGMVLTLEPGIETAPGRLLVHEENIVIRETGAEYLSTPAPRRLPRLESSR